MVRKHNLKKKKTQLNSLSISNASSSNDMTMRFFCCCFEVFFWGIRMEIENWKHMLISFLLPATEKSALRYEHEQKFDEPIEDSRDIL